MQSFAEIYYTTFAVIYYTTYVTEWVCVFIHILHGHFKMAVRKSQKTLPVSEKCGEYTCVYGLVQDCSISIANALEILQSCTKPSYGRINHAIALRLMSKPQQNKTQHKPMDICRTLKTLSRYVANFVVTAASGATSDTKIGTMTSHGFQCTLYIYLVYNRDTNCRSTHCIATQSPVPSALYINHLYPKICFSMHCLALYTPRRTFRLSMAMLSMTKDLLLLKVSWKRQRKSASWWVTELWSCVLEASVRGRKK